MIIGLIGLPNSGKTTIFNALTGSDVETASYSSAKVEPNQAMVEVKDERMTALSKLYKPKKTIYATINVMDFVGMAKDSSEKSNSIPDETIRLMKNVDALTVVLQNFENELGENGNGLDDINSLVEELSFSDLMLVEKRFEKIEHMIKRGQKTNELVREQKVLEKILERLNNGDSLNDLEITPDDEKLIRGFQLFLLKPILVILNSDENSYGKNQKLLDELSKEYTTVEFAGKFEMELNQIDDKDEVEMFMEDIGITESAQIKLTKSSYELLGNISFFTVGEDEVRAWTIVNGSTAPQAAGAIHTDLERGFIRAECFSYENIMKHGSEKSLKENGLFKLEGKDYIVKDGDILSIRFNV